MTNIRAKARQDLGNGIFKSQWMTALAACLIYSVIVGILSAIPYVGSIASLLLAGPMAFGLVRYFMKSARDESPAIENLFDGFSDFVGNFCLYFMMNLFLVLWSLLFVIPGIIKSYSYSMAFYIKNDHPEYSWKECIDESRRMMDGHKFDLFCLQLSFIGWALLCILTVGIGYLWLVPYMQAATANFYDSLVVTPAKKDEADTVEGNDETSAPENNFASAEEAPAETKETAPTEAEAQTEATE